MMETRQQWNVLFIKDDSSGFDAETKMFGTVFKSVDIASGKEDALKLYEANQYDIVIADLSVEPERVGLLKQLQDIKSGQTIFAMLSPKDADKLFGIADLGINAFELLPEQFDMALEEIACFNPYS